MASFTGVGDNVTLFVPMRDEFVDIALSGTYNMTILFQREVGAKGSGAWETINTYTTANATVADVYYTRSENENLRLIVTVDTSGTCTATLTDRAGRQLVHVVDKAGNTLYEIFEGGAFVPKNTPVALDAATTLTRAKHANRPLTHSAAAGYDVTLPAATGSGDVYKVHVLTTVASTDLVIQAASSADEMHGAVGVSTDAGGVVILAADGDDTLTMNGSTSGGVLGSHVSFTDIASGVWHVGGFLVSTGAEATPFSAAV